MNDVLARSGAAAVEVEARDWGQYRIELAFLSRREFGFAFDGVTGARLP